jgi:hypothetical protein
VLFTVFFHPAFTYQVMEVEDARPLSSQQSGKCNHHGEAVGRLLPLVFLLSGEAAFPDLLSQGSIWSHLCFSVHTHLRCISTKAHYPS